MDLERLERARQAMAEAGIDVLVCRLAENVLYLSGYWPITGANMVVFPREDEPALILQEEELDFLGPDCVKDVRTYQFTNLALEPGINHKIAPVLASYFQEKGLNKATVGYEGSFEVLGCVNTAIAARVVTESSINFLKTTLPEATLVDATAAIWKARRVKSRFEIEKHRLANEVACLGLEAAREAIRPGVTEAEVAAAVEAR
ncbi:MAG: aminopeptidase P family N-terminal domain-containing protein, partial [Chloroflexi bacterium]|nr:aminopeptidase P family N-terminal domain-containing protein [Chloroflexota bacterium]